MALTRLGESNCPGLLPGHAIYDVKSPWHHAMMVASEPAVSVTNGSEFQVFEMAPPLGSRALRSADSQSGHWVGHFEELEIDRLALISAEALRILQNVRPSADLHSGYDLSQHEVLETDRNDPDSFVVHASCASFVEHCYQTEGIDLVHGEHVPEVQSRSHLAKIVQLNEPLLSRFFRGRTEPDWPCRVLLPSYQMRAFRGAMAELPYRPQLSDHPFT